MRDVFKRIISSIQRHPREWADNHKPKGGILSHKSGITVYASPFAKIASPANIKATWRESWLLTRAMKTHQQNTKSITDDEIIKMLD